MSGLFPSPQWAKIPKANQMIRRGGSIISDNRR